MHSCSVLYHVFANLFIWLEGRFLSILKWDTQFFQVTVNRRHATLYVCFPCDGIHSTHVIAPFSRNFTFSCLFLNFKRDLPCAWRTTHWRDLLALLHLFWYSRGYAIYNSGSMPIRIFLTGFLHKERRNALDAWGISTFLNWTHVYATNKHCLNH